MVGTDRLRVQQVVDIVSGAIDAWLSTDVRRAATAAGVQQGGTTMSARAFVCAGSKSRYTTRDGLIGAAIMLAISLTCLAIGIAARRNGFPVAGEMLKAIAFPASMTLSMPFWLLKGQPWKAQVVLVGGTVGLLVAISYIATLI